MQLRMLARRCPSGSMTILGDLAQGTGVWANDSWEDVLAQLPQPDGARVEELRLGYRAPAQVIELASGLLPTIAPQVTPTESVRRGRTEPHVVRTAAAQLAATAAEEAIALTADHHSVAVIVPDAVGSCSRSSAANSKTAGLIAIWSRKPPYNRWSSLLQPAARNCNSDSSGQSRRPALS